MSLSTEKYLKNISDAPQHYLDDAGWLAISRALRYIVHGYCILIVGGLVGAAMIWLASHDGQWTIWLETTKQDPALLLSLGFILLGLTALLSYGLVMIGYWFCTMYAPNRENAKELMYVCLNFICLASIFNVLGAYIDGGQTYAALQEGWGEVARLDHWSTGLMLEFGSAGLGLVSALVFNQFLHNVAKCFDDHRRVRRVFWNFLFVGLLLGGSIGTFFCVRQLAPKTELLPWLFGGWLLCFAWHVWLVRDIRHCVDEHLHAVETPVAPVEPSMAETIPVANGAAPATAPEPAAVPMHTLSGLRRLMRTSSKAAVPPTIGPPGC